MRNSIGKVVYKPTGFMEEVLVIVDADEYERYRGDHTVPLTDVLEAFDVYRQTKRGIAKASSLLVNEVLGDDVKPSKSPRLAAIEMILNKGTLAASLVG